MSETVDPTEPESPPAPAEAPPAASQAPSPTTGQKRKALSHGLRVALVVLTVLLAIKGIHSLVPSDAAPPKIQAPAPARVRVVTLQQEQIAAKEERYGRLLPAQEWSLALEVGGRVKERPAFNGKHLEEGETIISLDPEPFEAEKAGAVARVTEAKASLTLAESMLVRVRQLRSTTATRENLEQAQARVDRATAAVSEAESQVRLATYRLKHSKIVAPVPGVVSGLAVEEGDAVSPGQPIGRHSRVNALLVKLLVSGEVRRGIDLGLKAQVIDGREVVHAATLVRAAPVQSGGTGQFELEFEVGNGARELMAGEAVRCRFEHGAGVSQLRVPRSSVYEEYGTWRALVAGDQAANSPITVQSVPVVLGPANPQEGWVEVFSGLKAGDRLIVPERTSGIHEGQQVVPGPVVTTWLPPYAREKP